MNNDFNDIVNKYIDKELNKEELDHVDKLIQSDNKFKSMITVHKYVHESLSELPLKFAPQGFTELVMNKIVNSLSEKYKKNYWFRGVVSIFSLILVIILFTFFYFIGDLGLVKSATESASGFTDKFIPMTSYFIDFIKTDIFKTVSGLLGFIILLLFYFNYNSHKQIEETLKEL